METDLVDSTGNGILDTFLHYGLFMGAIFQLICIFAVILVPSKDEEPEESLDDVDTPQPSSSTKVAESNSRRKQEKKKRR